MDGEGDKKTPSFSKDDSAIGLAIPRVLKFGYNENLLCMSGDKWMATCQTTTHQEMR